MLVGERLGDRRVEILEEGGDRCPGPVARRAGPAGPSAARSTAWRSTDDGPGAPAQSPPAIWQTARAAPSAICCAGPATNSAATTTATSSSIPTYSAATCPRSLRSMPSSVARRGGARQSPGLNLKRPEVPRVSGTSGREEGLQGAATRCAGGAAASAARRVRRRGVGRAAVRSSSTSCVVGTNGLATTAPVSSDIAAATSPLGDRRARRRRSAARRSRGRRGRRGRTPSAARAGRTSTGVMAGLLWGRRRAMKEGSRLGRHKFK